MVERKDILESSCLENQVSDALKDKLKNIHANKETSLRTMGSMNIETIKPRLYLKYKVAIVRTLMKTRGWILGESLLASGETLTKAREEWKSSLF